MICVLYIVVVGDLFTKAIENTEGTGLYFSISLNRGENI